MKWQRDGKVGGKVGNTASGCEGMRRHPCRQVRCRERVGLADSALYAVVKVRARGDGLTSIELIYHREQRWSSESLPPAPQPLVGRGLGARGGGGWWWRMVVADGEDRGLGLCFAGARQGG